MARSGVIYGTRRVNQWGPRLELHWDISSQSVKDNTTTIRVRSYFNVNGTISWNAYNYEGNTRINNGTRNTYYYTSSNSSERHRLMNTAYHTIKHDSNGNATVKLEGWFNVKVLYWSGVNVSEIYAGGDITLDRIIRGINESSFSLSSGWSNAVGNKTVTFSKYSSTAKVSLYYEYYNAKKNSWTWGETISGNYGSGTSFSFSNNKINDMHNNNPDSKTVQIRVGANIYQGQSKISSVTRTVSLKLKEESPSISGSFSLSGKNQHLLGSPSYAVQSIHTANIELNASGRNGASIKSYQIIFQGATFNSRTAKTLVTQSGNLSVVVKATDSRGITGTRTLGNIVSRPYVKPSLSNHVAERYQGLSPNPLGTSGKITGLINFKNVNNSSERNINEAYWRVSLSSSSTHNSRNISYTTNVAIENTLNYTLYFGDKFTDLQVTGQIASGQAPLVLGKKSIGINIVPGANKEGLFIKDDLINDLKVGLIYDEFYADHRAVGSNNYIEAIKANWRNIKEGLSFAVCRVATRGIAIIHKYPDGAYGSALTFGYGTKIKQYKYDNGKWMEVK
ncbi:hypothetical protein ABGF48_04280 [Helcococcus bovis]|uniref:hypothetical protein n=1 Tax=Helcococcus bovis TaxID=3153252 RepID=UPI0038B96FAD